MNEGALSLFQALRLNQLVVPLFASFTTGLLCGYCLTQVRGLDHWEYLAGHNNDAFRASVRV